MIAAQDHGLAPVSAVHSPEYLEFLQIILRAMADDQRCVDEVIPNIHRTAAIFPIRHHRLVVRLSPLITIRLSSTAGRWNSTIGVHGQQ